MGLSVIVTFGEVSGYTPSKGCVGLRVYGLHTGVIGHVANMCPGS